MVDNFQNPFYFFGCMLNFPVSGLIVDFDGVLVNSMPSMANFISQKLRISSRSAFSRIFRYSLTNRHSWFSEKIKKSQVHKYLKFLKEQPRDLLIYEMLETLRQIPLPKAILTTNYSFLCESILGEYAKDFSQIIGFDKVSSKTKGLDFLFENGFDAQNSLLITDTLGDTLEFLEVVKKEQILASSWGFCPVPVLQTALPKEQILTKPEDLLDFFKK